MTTGVKTTIIVLGFILVIAGAAFGAHQLGIPAMWIGIFSIVLLGIGVVTAASNTKATDEASS